MQWLGYVLFRGLTGLFWLIPFRALYVLSDGMAFVVYRIIGYRKKVVFGNLRRSFPEKSDAEIRQIAKKAYQNLMDVTLETLKSFSMPTPEFLRRAPVVNPELLNAYLDRGQSVILAGSHYNNWEWSGLSLPPFFHGKTITAYKPLSSKVANTFINRQRARTGMIMVSMDETFGAMRQKRDEPAVFILLSDQSPGSRKSAHWVHFMQQDTACLPGADVLGRKFRNPVLYYDIQRRSRGFYEVIFSEICAEPEHAEEGSITRAYMAKLESVIRQQPENWLWSHRRWKITR